MSCQNDSPSCVYGRCIDDACVCDGQWTGESCFVNPANSTPVGLAVMIVTTLLVTYNFIWAVRVTRQAWRRLVSSTGAMPPALKIAVLGCVACATNVADTVYALWNPFYDPHELIARIGFGFLRCSCAGICYVWATAMNPHREAMYRWVFGLSSVLTFVVDMLIVAIEWNANARDSLVVTYVVFPLMVVFLCILPIYYGARLLIVLYNLDAKRNEMGVAPLPFTGKVRLIILRLLITSALVFLGFATYFYIDLLAVGGMPLILATAAFAVVFSVLALTVVHFVVTPEDRRALAPLSSSSIEPASSHPPTNPVAAVAGDTGVDRSAIANTADPEGC